VSGFVSDNQKGKSGWGKITVVVLAGMLLITTLIIGISLPLSKNSELARTTEAATPIPISTKIEGSGDNISAAYAKDDFEVSGRPSSPDGTIKEVTLVAQEAELEIAPGKVVKTWTFNGTVPGPVLRFTEGDNVRIKFINKTPIPHTLHLHGNHDDVNDGVLPQVMPNQSYIYNITAGPAGALMYHCHANPTSLHIRMGMYGAMIIDPKDKPMKPAREFVVVMGEYDTKDMMKLDAEYYLINGYADQYMKNPLEAVNGELVRMYVINIGAGIPSQFHLHSTIFKAYPSGLLSNQPIDAQTIAVGPGDATIVEAKWKYPGAYLFHSHGIQEERGNMGEIHILDNNNNQNSSAQPTASSYILNNTTATAGKSISMFDWQYELQKKLQKPKIVDYTDAELEGKGIAAANMSAMHMSNEEEATAADHGNTGLNASNNNSTTNQNNNNNDNGNGNATKQIVSISIVNGASNPNSEQSYEPAVVTVKSGSTIVWTNNDSMMHTATSGSSESGPSGIFDTGVIQGSGKVAEATINAKPGSYGYYCSLHPYMKGQLTVTE
jgi:nitrite reductase (NO-forming)